MSKVSFRARQIDFNKPLPILKHGSELFLEISENALVNRGVPQIPSGMEKEEENEHHFVEVLNALQLQGHTSVKIPVPEIIDKEKEYLKLYPGEFVPPKQPVHIRSIVFSDQEPIEYDMDSEDEEWLRNSDLGISPEKFESMIDRLERGCGQKVMNLDEAKYLLHDHPSLVIAVYDYWLNKRVQSRQPLMFSVRQERRDGSSNTDPYVAFRRRSEKMQTRKNRKNDELSYEKMLILRDQVDFLGEILSCLVKRETIKEAIIECDYRCFQARCNLEDWDGCQMMDAENYVQNDQSIPISNAGIKSIKDKKRSSRKRKASRRPNVFFTVSSDEGSEVELDNTGDDLPFAFTRVPGCRYLKPRPLYIESEENMVNCPSYRLTTVPFICHSKRQVYTGYVRRRLGRGGRIVCDRFRPPSGANYFDFNDRELLTYYDHNSLQSKSNDNFCRPCARSKDQLLNDRLKTLVLNSHPGRPYFRWPCTKPPSISYEHLSFDPTQPFSTLRFSPGLDARKPSGEKPESIDFDSSRLLNDNNQTPVKFLSNLPKSNNTSATLSIDSSMSDCSPPVLVPKSANLISTPQRLWRKLVRPYGAIDVALQPDYPKHCIPNLQFNGSNGLDPPTTDGLLLTDPSVLPSKVRCITRDCTSRDSKVSGPQLQAANGVSASQILQLPI